MRNLLIVMIVALLIPSAGLAQKRASAKMIKGVAVAFWDDGRTDQATIQEFEYFLKPIQELVKRDFPGLEFKVLRRGELFELPDGTGLNVENLHEGIGFVLSQRGKKRRMLTGVQTDADFACAAASFFQRRSPACPKLN
jgi:hypothetical protein